MEAVSTVAAICAILPTYRVMNLQRSDSYKPMATTNTLILLRYLVESLVKTLPAYGNAVGISRQAKLGGGKCSQKCCRGAADIWQPC